MPRGIPKDPNHPKNQKKVVVADGAPKRRGRPPGSTNKIKAAAKAEAAPAQVAAPKKSKGKKLAQAVSSSSRISETLHVNSENDGADVIRQNLHILAQVATAVGVNAIVTDAIERHVEKLVASTFVTTTSAASTQVAEDAEDDSEEEAPASNGSVGTCKQPPLPAPPNFMPPPFPTS